jgi:hydrogenase maturation protease
MKSFAPEKERVKIRSTAMTQVLIVGYGNPLRCDDGLGWSAAEALSRSLPFPEMEIVVCHQLTPELADSLRSADIVFFIDAARDGQPGELSCEPVTLQPGIIRSHQLSPAHLLAMAQQLYGATPRAFTVSLCGECFDHGATLSSTVETALPKLTALVEGLIRQTLAQPYC